jgi:hypothetical protein
MSLRYCLEDACLQRFVAAYPAQTEVASKDEACGDFGYHRNLAADLAIRLQSHGEC